jgi:4-amino-4-deoxy-L-arabinose transferase-like glycosyltransferase
MIAINAISLFTVVMDQDSALYATIAKTMVKSGDWINLFSFGNDWLDKPHLPFWITALSFQILGISAFAYKLPSFLICLLGVFYLYKITKLLYNENVAKVASILFLSSLHLILANFDVRAEGYLTTFIIAGLYYLYKVYKNNGGYNIMLAALFCAAAIMTKGIFVLLTLTGGFIAYWLTTKQWRQFVNWRWWFILLLTILFITPELYCLYVQFDLHPEKTVWGQQNISGLRFFFYDSQFGRFFNTGPIQGKGDISFFIHSTLWAFLPWSIALVMSGISFLKRWKQQRNREIMIFVWSAFLSFLLFSFSKFQLPHYIVILFPHFAVFVAIWLTASLKNREKLILTWGMWISIILFIIIIACLSVNFPFFNIWLTAAAILTVLLALTGFHKSEWLNRFIWRGICFAFLSTLFWAQFIYGTIQQYNAGMNAAQWINQNCREEKVILLECKNTSMAFYLQSKYETREQLTATDFSNQDHSLCIFCPLTSLSHIDSQNINVEILKEFDYFRITMLTPKFLSSQKRSSQLKKYAVVRCTLHR